MPEKNHAVTSLHAFNQARSLFSASETTQIHPVVSITVQDRELFICTP